MVRKLSTVAFVVLTCLGSLAAAAYTVAAEYPPRENKPLGIEVDTGGDLLMMDSDGLGSYRLKQVEKTAPAAAPMPHFCVIHFVWDGVHLQIHPGWKDKRNFAKVDLEKDGWYVTADYGVTPPRVILTKEPTKHSAWHFVGGSFGKPNYIKNDNDGKAAWLVLKDTGKRYSRIQEVPVAPGMSPEFGIRLFEGSVSMAILSFEKKAATAFLVNDLERDDGK